MNPSQNNQSNVPQQPVPTTPLQGVGQQQSAQPIAPVQPPTTQVQQPVAPVGGPHKEIIHAQPAPSPVVEAPVEHYVKPTEVEPVLHAEVAQAGVETAPSSERAPLSQDLKQAGVTHSGPVQPVVVSQGPPIDLPMNEMQATTIAKKKKWHESVTWFAVFVLRQIKILQQEKKEVS